MVAPSRPVEALCLDLMGTLLEPIGGKRKAEFVSSIYLRYLPQRVTQNEVMAAVKRSRKRHLQEDYTSARERWIQVNLEVLRSWGAHEVSKEVAAQIHDAFTTHPELYEVRPDTRAFLEWARGKGIALAIISNQPRIEIERFLRYHELSGYFGKRIVSAEDVGSYKPRLRFFARAVQRLGYQPRAILHIGNSLQHDAAGSKVVRTCLLLREGPRPRKLFRAQIESGMLAYFDTWERLRFLLERRRLIVGKGTSHPLPALMACATG